MRTYVAAAFGDESEVQAWFGEPTASGDRAAVQWWAALREAGEEVTLVGTSVLRFDTDGLVADQYDTWHLIAGRREPPSGWGRQSRTALSGPGAGSWQRVNARRDSLLSQSCASMRLEPRYGLGLVHKIAEFPQAR